MSKMKHFTLRPKFDLGLTVTGTNRGKQSSGVRKMDSAQFKEFGTAALEYLADYHDNIRERPVLPSVNPGYLRSMIPDNIPEKPETWQEIFKDLDRVIMPGVTHWKAPGFNSYYPITGSYPSIIGDMLSAGIGVMGFNWMTSPACTELELVVMDWLPKAMDLPSDCYNSSESTGGGCLQSTTSESTLIALIAAKEKTARRVQKLHPERSIQEIKSKMVAYSSNQSNSSVEKAGKLASVPMRLLPPDANGSLRGETVEQAIKTDLRKGLIPCYVVATFGTTPTCAFDNLDEIGPVCKKYDTWLHVDAAYAGAALICPELRHYMSGIQHADSLVINLYKWLLVNFGCAAMWLKSSRDIEEAFSVHRIYLAHKPKDYVPDFRNWQIPLGRPFRSLKVWFTLRAYGLQGLQQHIRNHLKFALQFEKLILADPRFELATATSMGLVCFRAKGENKLSSAIIEELNNRKKVYMIPGKMFDDIFIRFVVSSPTTTSDDIINCVQEVIKATDIVMERMKENTTVNDNKVKKRFIPMKTFMKRKHNSNVQYYQRKSVSICRAHNHTTLQC